MTENANPTLGKIEDIFEILVWDTLVKAGLAALFTAVPVLAVWPVAQIITYVVNLFSSKLYAELRMVVDLQAIAFVNNRHKAAFDEAVVKLKIIARDRGVESEDFRKAKKDATEKLAKFVRFNGS